MSRIKGAEPCRKNGGPGNNNGEKAIVSALATCLLYTGHELYPRVNADIRYTFHYTATCATCVIARLYRAIVAWRLGRLYYRNARVVPMVWMGRGNTNLTLKSSSGLLRRRRLSSGDFPSSYQDLLDLVDLPTLECRRLETRLCLLYKIIYNLCYFDEGVFTLRTSLSHHVPHNLVLNHPFARINSYFYSFVPHTTSYWNNLDSSIVCASSLRAFKNSLHVHPTSPL